MKDLNPAVQKVLGVILLALSLGTVSYFSTQVWMAKVLVEKDMVPYRFDGVWWPLGTLDRMIVSYPLAILPVAVGFSLLVDIHGTFLTYMAFAKWNFISWWIAFTLPCLPVWLLCDALNVSSHVFIVANIIVLVLAVGLPLIGYLDDEKRAFYKRIRLQ